MILFLHIEDRAIEDNCQMENEVLFAQVTVVKYLLHKTKKADIVILEPSKVWQTLDEETELSNDLADSYAFVFVEVLCIVEKIIFNSCLYDKVCDVVKLVFICEHKYLVHELLNDVLKRHFLLLHCCIDSLNATKALKSRQKEL